jgi:lipopolysaccharide transport system permease protein
MQKSSRASNDCRAPSFVSLGDQSNMVSPTESQLSRSAPAWPEQSNHVHELVLPDQPLVTIRPQAGWVGLNLRDLWAFRELLVFLAWRDVKVRYKQTALGVAWAIMQPLFNMLIFTLFFGQLVGIPSNGVAYPLFAYTALLPWTFFANAATASGNSVVGSTSLITKVYFPRMIIPSAAVLAGLVDFAIASVLMIGMMVYYEVGLTVNVLLFPLLVLETTVLAIGVGMYMAALNVKYRDIRYALPFFIQIGLFVTPIIYPSTMVPEHWRWLLALNPLAGIIEGYRSSLLGQPVDWLGLVLSACITSVIFAFSAFAFRRMEKNFADIV